MFDELARWPSGSPSRPSPRPGPRRRPGHMRPPGLLRAGLARDLRHDHVGVHVDRHALSLRARSAPGRRRPRGARRARRARRACSRCRPTIIGASTSIIGTATGSRRAPPPRRSRRGRAARNQVANATSTAADSLSASVLRAIERIAPNEPRATSAPPSAAVAASSPSVTPSSGESSPSSASTVRTALSDHMNARAEREDRVALDRHAATARGSPAATPRTMIGAMAASATALRQLAERHRGQHHAEQRRERDQRRRARRADARLAHVEQQPAERRSG